jgi:mannose-6-phosphate isomerase-like protein (cupin superfamily)
MIRREGQMKVEVREKMRGGEGAVTIRHCFEQKEFTAPVRLCARLVLPPGASIGPHAHEKEDEVYVVLAGSGVLNDGNADKEVRAGDAVLTGRGGSHSIRNSGPTDLEIAAFIACYPEKPDA